MSAIAVSMSVMFAAETCASSSLYYTRLSDFLQLLNVIQRFGRITASAKLMTEVDDWRDT